jgi:hypothetical protein
LQPGPVKRTVELDASKFDPLRVSVNAWPLIGGAGLVVKPVTTGADAAADTFSETAPELRPVELFFTETEKPPVARIAWPEICVLEPLALMLHGEAHPGPLK